MAEKLTLVEQYHLARELKINVFEGLKLYHSHAQQNKNCCIEASATFQDKALIDFFSIKQKQLIEQLKQHEREITLFTFEAFVDQQTKKLNAEEHI